MITVIFYFDLPKGISRKETLRKYRKTAQAWSKNEDLVQKHYFFDEEKSLGGGVYIWKTIDAARKWQGNEYKTRVKKVYGSEVRTTCLDTMLMIDNVSGQISEPREG